ncbi:MAG TPA: HIT family protein [Candidatus Woesearchaeota archaeon]|nr:HIT family protein [Candidatus Woesearchaeota archaeon]
MNNCIFCKIVNGEIPCSKIYDDELVMSFLDVNPTSDGHLLVIPKEHYENVADAPEEVLTRISKICKKMGLLVKDKLGASGFNIINASGKDAQQSVFHLHFHVVPRYKNDGLDLWFHGKAGDKEKIKEIKKKLLS